MMTDHPDADFRLAVAQLVHSILHDVAFHPHATERLLKNAEDLGELLEGPRETEHVCWTIAREICSIPGPQAVYAAQMAADGNGTEPLDIDATPPGHRALTRYVSCAINNDTETGSAVFATIPFDDYEDFMRMLLWNVARHLREYQASACRP